MPIILTFKSVQTLFNPPYPPLAN